MEAILTENLKRVEERIQYACQRANRDRSEVTLIAVSKTKPLPMLESIYQAGIREFGENKVQELCEKQEALPSDIHWHMIGHLQRNKVKQTIDKACLIHSVDSIRLARQIEEEAAKRNKIMPVLIEVNVAQEESKFGITIPETEAFVREISAYPHILIKGLMTIAPFVENPEDNRIYFYNLKQLFVDINQKNIDNVCMDILSMGMTNDYGIAIEEGATHIRVGTGIFGERIYQ